MEAKDLSNGGTLTTTNNYYRHFQMCDVKCEVLNLKNQINIMRNFTNVLWYRSICVNEDVDIEDKNAHAPFNKFQMH